jgi:hypothetical protein
LNGCLLASSFWILLSEDWKKAKNSTKKSASSCLRTNYNTDLDQVLRDAIFQDNTAQLNMRLPPAMKAVLSKLARQRTTDATTLARIWLAERLE